MDTQQSISPTIEGSIIMFGTWFWRCDVPTGSILKHTDLITKKPGRLRSI